MTEISWTCERGLREEGQRERAGNRGLGGALGGGLGSILRATFLGAAARATTTGVETRDIIFSFWSLVVGVRRVRFRWRASRARSRVVVMPSSVIHLS